MDEPNLRYILSKLGISVQNKSGEWLEAHCPFAPFFHKSGRDHRPSFAAKIYPTGISAYYCHACHQHGRIASLARALGHYRHQNQFYYQQEIAAADQADRENLIFGDFDSLPEIRDLPQEPLIEEVYENLYEFPIKNQEAIKYLTGRNISLKTAEDLELRYDEHQRRILFPIKRPDNSLMGFSSRSIVGAEPKVRDYAGLKKRQHILGCHRWRWYSKLPLIIVEGLFGYAHLVELGVEKIADIGAVLGSVLTDPKREIIIKRKTATILLSDNDEAGDLFLFGRNNDGAIKQLSGQGFKVFAPEWPQGKSDPDQLNKREIWNMIKELEDGNT